MSSGVAISMSNGVNLWHLRAGGAFACVLHRVGVIMKLLTAEGTYVSMSGAVLETSWLDGTMDGWMRPIDEQRTESFCVVCGVLQSRRV